MRALAVAVLLAVAVGWFAWSRKWRVEVDWSQNVGDYGPIDVPVGRIRHHIH